MNTIADLITNICTHIMLHVHLYVHLPLHVHFAVSNFFKKNNNKMLKFFMPWPLSLFVTTCLYFKSALELPEPSGTGMKAEGELPVRFMAQIATCSVRTSVYVKPN